QASQQGQVLVVPPNERRFHACAEVALEGRHVAVVQAAAEIGLRWHVGAAPRCRCLVTVPFARLHRYFPPRPSSLAKDKNEASRQASRRDQKASREATQVSDAHHKMSNRAKLV